MVLFIFYTLSLNIYIYTYRSYIYIVAISFISFFLWCTFYVTDIFLTALIPIQLNLFKQIIPRKHSSRMNNNGDNGNHPFSPGSKNSWLRKKTKTKKNPNIFSAAVRDVCKSHRNPFIMLTAIFSLNQRQRKGTNKTQKLTRKATGYCRVGDQ